MARVAQRPSRCASHRRAGSPRRRARPRRSRRGGRRRFRVRLFRVYPHAPTAAPGDPGHALHVPPVQGGGLIDNPGLYRVLYAGDSPAGAVAERFGNLGIWTDAMFESGGALSGTTLALAEYEATALRV